MGRGNVCVHGEAEGLYYIDCDYFDTYVRVDDETYECESCLADELSYDDLTSGEWSFDEALTGFTYNEIIDEFKENFVKLFPSFCEVEPYWIGWRNTKKVILENELFQIATEDNEWSVAVELLQKDEAPIGLQLGLYKRYLDGIAKALLKILPTIGTYGGAWTSGHLSRQEVIA